MFCRTQVALKHACAFERTSGFCTFAQRFRASKWLLSAPVKCFQTPKWLLHESTCAALLKAPDLKWRACATLSRTQKAPEQTYALFSNAQVPSEHTVHL